MSKQIVIVGGGAAGFFSAIHHKKANPKASVIIIEKSSKVLQKVKISGGGRCNLTHSCFEPKALVQNYPRGHKELLGPFYTFQAKHTVAWFNKHGVAVKTEADGRIFPQSNTSQTIIDCLRDTTDQLGISVWTNCIIQSINKTNSQFMLSLKNGNTLQCDTLVLATGSSPWGFQAAKQFGHTVHDPIPSLFTFKINDPNLHSLSGLSIKNAEVKLSGKKSKIITAPLLITHWGLSGPAIIKLSAWEAKRLFEQNYNDTLLLNFLPAYSSYDILQMLHTFAKKNPQKHLVSVSPFLELPQRIWAYLINRLQFSEQSTWISLQKKAFNRLLSALTQSQFLISGKGQFKEEFVTCGGVSLKEINFKNMESKVCPGLHIIGELLNIDGVTGGFNFQNAWTTAYLSAQLK